MPNPNHPTEISTHPPHRHKWPEALPSKIQMLLVSIQRTRDDVASLWESWRPYAVQTEADGSIGGHIGTLDFTHESIGDCMREFTSKD
jgi:hypothetical protein